MKANDRVLAVQILTTLLTNKIPLTHLLHNASTASPFTKALCFGVCRHYYRLEVLANTLLTKRPKPLEVWVTILLGLYQLTDLNSPEYAIVQETVAILTPLKVSWAKGLVNAVLRRYCREKDTLTLRLNTQPVFIYDHPPWLIQHLKNAWPNDWEAILLANNERPPMSLRVNSQRSSTTDYLKQLNAVGIAASTLLFANQGLQLQQPCDVHNLPGFADGVVSVQDEAAQLAIPLLNLQPGLSVLDACCAPGGKTCHILETQPKLKRCVALDNDAHRLKRVMDNLQRLRLPATILTADALKPAEWWDGVLFERILLDAPCSATGVIRRHPDIKLLRTPEDITAITALQRDLLESLWPLLAPGGQLVYATCSVLPEENHLQIKAFVARHLDCKLSNPAKPWGHAQAHGRQIFPGEHGMDGFFYSVLSKRS